MDGVAPGDEGRSRLAAAIDLEGLDFVFVAAVLLGLYALHRLLAVQERGEVDDSLELAEVYREVRRTVRHVGNVAGLRRLSHFPYDPVRRPGRRNGDRDDGSRVEPAVDLDRED